MRDSVVLDGALSCPSLALGVWKQMLQGCHTCGNSLSSQELRPGIIFIRESEAPSVAPCYSLDTGIKSQTIHWSAESQISPSSFLSFASLLKPFLFHLGSLSFILQV